VAEAQAGVVVPPDSTGKALGAFSISKQDGSVVWVGATVVVDANGYEIGNRMVEALEDIAEQLRELRAAAELSEVLTSA
jgi:hypothetical protein